MAASFLIDPSKGDTPQSVAQQRQIAAVLASRILGRAPKNVGEGLSAIGQALIARTMMGDATDAQKAGLASGNNAFSKISSMISGGAPAATVTPPVPSSPTIPSDALSGNPLQDTPATLSGGFMSASAPQAQNGSPAAPSQFQPLIANAAKQYGIPEDVLTRQLHAESAFNPNAVSPAGATGIAQFMPATAKDMGVNPLDPASAIPGAAQYVAQNRARYGGDMVKALAAYNWGPGNVDKWVAAGADPSKLPAETRNYVTKILGPNAFSQGGPVQVASNDPNFVPGFSPLMNPQLSAMLKPTPTMTPQQMADGTNFPNTFQPSDVPNAPVASNVTNDGLKFPNTVSASDVAPMAFNGQPQNGNPLAAPLPQPQPSGFAPMPAGQPNITTAQVRPAQLPFDNAPQAQAAPVAPAAQSGPSIQMLMKAASNPWLNPGQRAVVSEMLKQKLTQQQQAADPLRQLQIQQARKTLSKSDAPTDVQEYEYAKKQGFDGSFIDFQKSLKAGATPSTVQEYEYAKNQGFKGTLADWMAQKRAGAGEYSLQPIYGTDENGNPIVIQLGKSGESIQSKLPKGVRISTGVEKIDLGDKWALLDKRSGQYVGTIPKDLAAAAAAKAKGTIQGTAQGTLPTDLMNGDQTVAQIDQLLKNPGLDSIVGPIDQFRPSYMLGDQGRDALARYNQLKGKAFLSAYATLKGGGQITEVEGAKAENAMARMDRAQNEATFRSALSDFRDAVKLGMQKLREKAGLPAAQPGIAAPAAAGPAMNKTKSGVQWSVE